jgi:hypothetical protein
MRLSSWWSRPRRRLCTNLAKSWAFDCLAGYFVSTFLLVFFFSVGLDMSVHKQMMVLTTH